jgi:hypothetical protein
MRSDAGGPPLWNRAIRQLDSEYAARATAVQTLKVMGMEMKSKAGGNM